MNLLKSLALAAFVVSASAASAQQGQPEDFGAFTTMDAQRFDIVKVEYQMISPRCPVGMMCPAVLRAPVTHTVVTLRATHACLGRVVGDVHTHSQVIPGGVLVFVGATEFVDEDTIRVRCFRAPTTDVKVTIQGRFSERQLKIMNFDRQNAETF